MGLGRQPPHEGAKEKLVQLGKKKRKGKKLIDAMTKAGGG